MPDDRRLSPGGGAADPRLSAAPPGPAPYPPGRAAPAQLPPRPERAGFPAGRRSVSAACFALRNRLRLTTDAIARSRCSPPRPVSLPSFTMVPTRRPRNPSPLETRRWPGRTAVAKLTAAAALQHEEPDRARQIAAALGVDLR